MALSLTSQAKKMYLGIGLIVEALAEFQTEQKLFYQRYLVE